MLAARAKKIDVVIALKVDEEILLSRVEQRIKENTARADNNPETMKNRLNVYRRDAAPLLGHYGRQGNVVSIDGMAPIDGVTKAIAAILDRAAAR